MYYQIKKKDSCTLIKSDRQSVCASRIKRDYFEKFVDLFTNELIYFSSLKDEIFMGVYKLNKAVSLDQVPDLILDTSYDDFIDKLYEKNNLIYLNSNFEKSYLTEDKIANMVPKQLVEQNTDIDSSLKNISVSVTNNISKQSQPKKPDLPVLSKFSKTNIKSDLKQSDGMGLIINLTLQLKMVFV